MSETSIKQAHSLQRIELFRLRLWWGFSGQRDPSHIASGSHIEPNCTRFFVLNFGGKLQEDRDHDLNCGPKHIDLSAIFRMVRVHRFVSRALGLHPEPSDLQFKYARMRMETVKTCPRTANQSFQRFFGWFGLTGLSPALWGSTLCPRTCNPNMRECVWNL